MGSSNWDTMEPGSERENELPLEQSFLASQFIIIWVDIYGQWAASLQSNECCMEENHLCYPVRLVLGLEMGGCAN